MPAHGITCREFVDFLGDYLEDELGGPVRERFEAHLRVCPDCVAYLESFRETIRLGRECYGPDDELPGEAPPELVAAVLEARRRAPDS